MQKNWSFRVGVALFFAQGLALMSGVPVVLGLVSVMCIACLLAGLFRYAISEVGIVELVIYTVVTAFLILIAGRALFLFVESLTYDTSADVYVGYVLFTAWPAALVALIYGIIRRVRKYPVA